MWLPIIERKPTVALVDELAHTNAPDSKNRKRYEDVEDLLGAGINVISTVNIQHLESLYNFVEQATGVKVKERVPDEFLLKADQIVNIDLPAEDLQERLLAGKIYPKERIEAALANFFTQKHLTRLREMTLTETANFLDRQQRAGADNEQNVSALGQVMVAISSQGPDPGRLLRKTARLASQLNAQWYAVYVRTLAGIRGENRRRRPAPRHRHPGDRAENGRPGILDERRGRRRDADFFFQRIRNHAHRYRPARAKETAEAAPTDVDREAARRASRRGSRGGVRGAFSV